ncbi:hypothetical protein Tco_0386238 [Tanacetum coccineum]
MGKLAFCDYHNMVAILDKTEHNTDFHQIVDWYALMVRPTVYVAHIQQFWSTARVETVDEATKIIATVNGRQRTLTESSIRRHIKLNDAECLSPKSTSFNEFSCNIATAIVCLATNRVYNFSKMIFDGMVRNIKSKGKFLMYPRTTRGTTWISQSKVPSPGADETASPTGDDRHGEAFPAATSLDAGMQQKLPELMDMCTNLQQQHLLMEQRIQREDLIGADAKKNTKKGSDSTDETTNVLSTLGAANELSSRVLVFAPTDIATIATVTPIAPAGVATASGSFPTTAIFTTASVKTPSTRKTRSSRGITIESSQTTSVPFISTKGKKGWRKWELGIMIAELDRSNELIAKYMNEYEQAEADLSLEEKMELITELVKYQKNLAEIKKYQAQQSKPTTKKEKRNYYMSILRSNAG